MTADGKIGRTEAGKLQYFSKSPVKGSRSVALDSLVDRGAGGQAGEDCWEDCLEEASRDMGEAGWISRNCML